MGRLVMLWVGCLGMLAMAGLMAPAAPVVASASPPAVTTVVYVPVAVPATGPISTAALTR